MPTPQERDAAIDEYRQRELTAMREEPVQGIPVAQVAHDLGTMTLTRICLGGTPPPPLNEKIVADLAELLAIVGKAHRDRLTVRSCDDFRRGLCGFIVEERDTLYQVTLDSLKMQKYNAIPEEIAALFHLSPSDLKDKFETSEGRRFLAGEPTEKDLPPNTEIEELKNIFLAEAEADRPVNMGDLGLERPPATIVSLSGKKPPLVPHLPNVKVWLSEDGKVVSDGEGTHFVLVFEDEAAKMKKNMS